ncbi:hypothetical protein XAP6164_4000012 [Xanthomonas phaseoli pv. phaseoli]|nr:hypothetical protein XAP6164_4000012 [Xanthomonas phaseoli pv. phaseoli]
MPTGRRVRQRAAPWLQPRSPSRGGERCTGQGHRRTASEYRRVPNRKRCRMLLRRTTGCGASGVKTSLALR